MAYLTKAEALNAAGAVRLLESARTELRKAAAAAPRDQVFDVFLSHSYEDARLILGVKALLQRQRLSVYVDWVEDNELDRTKVDEQTANTLRLRMRRSRYLAFATSSNSSKSRWMPWELGYFDGHKPGKIGILPLVDQGWESFAGQEYLGLYPVIQRAQLAGGGRRFELRSSAGYMVDLRQQVDA